MQYSSATLVTDNHPLLCGGIIFLLFYIAAIVLGRLALVWLAWRQRKHQQALHWQATHDPLTGLCNRIAFEQAVAREVAATGQSQSQGASQG